MSAATCIGFEIPARDPAALAAFYRDVLGFRISVWRTTGAIELRLGECEVHLRPARGGRRMPHDSRSHDRWFRHLAIVVRDMPLAHARVLRAVPTTISECPQKLPDWNPDAAGIEAFYFRDPEGHPLELIRFPPHKGRPQWHQPGEDLFQGIDHSAVVVSNASASARFYAERTGYRAVAESHNHGIEQQRLSGVQGADLRVITLATARVGHDDLHPHLELLEYRHPRDGRPVPEATSADDTWAVQTLFSHDSGHSPLLRSTREELLDPDGHRLVIA